MPIHELNNSPDHSHPMIAFLTQRNNGTHSLVLLEQFDLLLFWLGRSWIGQERFETENIGTLLHLNFIQRIRTIMILCQNLKFSWIDGAWLCLSVPLWNRNAFWLFAYFRFDFIIIRFSQLWWLPQWSKYSGPDLVTSRYVGSLWTLVDQWIR